MSLFSTTFSLPYSGLPIVRPASSRSQPYSNKRDTESGRIQWLNIADTIIIGAEQVTYFWVRTRRSYTWDCVVGTDNAGVISRVGGSGSVTAVNRKAIDVAWPASVLLTSQRSPRDEKGRLTRCCSSCYYRCECVALGVLVFVGFGERSIIHLGGNGDS